MARHAPLKKDKVTQGSQVILPAYPILFLIIAGAFIFQSDSRTQNSGTVGTRQWMDYGVSYGQNAQPDPNRVYLGHATRGLMSYGDGLFDTDQTGYQLSATQALISNPNGDLNYRVDRLFLPNPPA